MDPVDDNLIDCLCWHSFAARQYDDSIRMARELLARVPDDTWEMAILAWDFEQKGMYEEAIANFKKAVDITSKDVPIFNAFFLAGLGHAYAVAGRRGEAETVLQDLLQRAKQSYVSPFDIALIYTGLGEKDTIAPYWAFKLALEEENNLPGPCLPPRRWIFTAHNCRVTSKREAEVNCSNQAIALRIPLLGSFGPRGRQ